MGINHNIGVISKISVSAVLSSIITADKQLSIIRMMVTLICFQAYFHAQKPLQVTLLLSNFLLPTFILTARYLPLLRLS